MQEPVGYRKCSYCHQEVIWKWSGKKLKDGSKIYVDGYNARWAGRRCPDCERTRVQAAIKCDRFKKDIIIKELSAQGYQILSYTLPIKVKKQNSELKVGILYAYTDSGKLVLEKTPEKGADIYAIVFESVRLCSPEQLEQLGPNISLYSEQAITSPSTDSQSSPLSQNHN